MNTFDYQPWLSSILITLRRIVALLDLNTSHDRLTLWIKVTRFTTSSSRARSSRSITWCDRKKRRFLPKTTLLASLGTTVWMIFSHPDLPEARSFLLTVIWYLEGCERTDCEKLHKFTKCAVILRNHVHSAAFLCAYAYVHVCMCVHVYTCTHECVQEIEKKIVATLFEMTMKTSIPNRHDTQFNKWHSAGSNLHFQFWLATFFPESFHEKLVSILISSFFIVCIPPLRKRKEAPPSRYCLSTRPSTRTCTCNSSEPQRDRRSSSLQ